MSPHARTAQERRWFARDDIVRVGQDLGRVLAADLDGVHFIELLRERRVIAVACDRIQSVGQESTVDQPDERLTRAFAAA